MRARGTAAALLLAAAAGCATNGNELVIATPTAHPTAPASVPTTAPAPRTTSLHPGPAVQVSPSTGLTDGQTVHVTGTGFTPGTTYVVAECADKGSKTGQGDCDIPDIVPATADSTGAVSTDYPVKIGPFGANHIVCSTSQPCLISVTNPGNSSQEADARISFR